MELPLQWIEKVTKLKLTWVLLKASHLLWASVGIESQIADRTGIYLIVTFPYYPKLEKGCSSLFEQSNNFFHAKDALLQVWLKLVKLFSIIFFYCTSSQCIFFHYASIIAYEKGVALIWTMWIILPKIGLVWLKSVIINFSGRDSQMKRKCTRKFFLNRCVEGNKLIFTLISPRCEVVAFVAIWNLRFSVEFLC